MIGGTARCLCADDDVIRYFRSLWRGEIPLSRALWIDMLAVGTLVNVAILVAILASVAADAPTAVPVAIYLAHIPYSFLVFGGVWRSAENDKSGFSMVARVIAAAWLVVVLIA